MKIKLPLSLIAVHIVLFFFIFTSSVLAEGNLVEPKFPVESTLTMFAQTKEFERNELIIKFHGDTTASKKQQILDSIGGMELSNLLGGEFTLVSVPKGSDLAAIADQLLQNKAVEFIQPNYKVESTFTPNDSGYKNQWYLKKIQMPKAWDVTKGSAAITVAVVDTGVQTNHPDLKGKIVSPYNAVTGGTTFSAEAHGTHVAGIIAASINNSGVAGIAPNTKIMPINIFSGSGADMFDAAKAVIYAADKGANVINLSFGSYYYSYVLDYATTYAKQKGVTIIAAAGNDDTSMAVYPASLPSVISVSATDSSDRITYFSNFGYNIDIAAPGEGIYSTVNGSSYKNMDGTSMASPVVAGVAASILAKNPLLTPSQVESILTKSAVDLGTKGKDVYYGNGRVDAYKALQQTPAPLSAIATSASFTASGTNRTYLNFTAQKGATVSVYIQNAKGGIVRKLVEPKKWTGGKLSTSWDGKQDNGLFALSATYTIVAKLTNGKEIAFKKSTVKLANKVKPTINMNASALFSPTASNKLAVSYELNQSTVVTAKIYDSSNRLVKTLLSNKTVGAKTNKLEWNGTNANGQKVKDSVYKLVVSGIAANKLKAADAKMSIKTDTAKPAAQIAIVASPFKSDGLSKPATKITFKEKVTVSMFVLNDKGVKIKTLASNKAYIAGTATLNWDGKNNQGAFVGEGKYVYQAEVKDAAGNLLTAKSAVFSLQDWQKPVIKAAPDFLYQTAGNASFSYSLNKAAVVTIQLLSNGQIVRTMEMAAAKNAGTNTFIWNGKDQDGNTLADGTYQYQITAADQRGNSGSLTGNMKVSLATIKIDYPSVVPFYGEDYGSDVYYKLSHASTVTVEIYTSANLKVRTIETASSQAGINHFNWNGENDGGMYTYPEEELHYYVIKAKNSAGKETVAKGKISNEVNPDWLLSQNVSFIPSSEYSWENLALSIAANVSMPMEMTLYVYDAFYSDTLQDEITYNLTAGKNTLNYTKRSMSDLYYILEYKDALGNAYLYGVDELDYYMYSTSIEQMAVSPEKLVP